MQLYRDIRHRLGQAWTLRGLGLLAIATSHDEDGLDYLGQAHDIYRQIGLRQDEEP